MAYMYLSASEPECVNGKEFVDLIKKYIYNCSVDEQIHGRYAAEKIIK
jgi:hypothetical protein